MGNPDKFPFESHILELREGEETIIVIKGRPILMTPATEDDIIRLQKGYFCMD